MGLFLRQDEQRSDVQQKVATELQERLRNKSIENNAKVDPAFLDGQHTTKKSGMIFMIVFAVLVVAVIVYAIRVS